MLGSDSGSTFLELKKLDILYQPYKWDFCAINFIKAILLFSSYCILYFLFLTFSNFHVTEPRDTRSLTVSIDL
jgi:hypothetical protein